MNLQHSQYLLNEISQWRLSTNPAPISELLEFLENYMVQASV